MKYWPWYVALGLVSFIVVAGGIIGSRLSEQTLAFMAGVIFGGVTALPIGVDDRLVLEVAAPIRSGGVRPAAAADHFDRATSVSRDAQREFVCRAASRVDRAQCAA